MPKGYHQVTREIRPQIYALKATGTSLHKISTIVDRHSKFTRIKKLGRKTAENVRIAMKEVMGSLPYPVFTVTYDNGMEFAAPYHSWKRGLNEHTNGLIRQYLPKSVDFKDVTNDEIQAIEDQLNNRPRKILGYKTPMEVMMKHQNFQTSQPVTLDG